MNQVYALMATFQAFLDDRFENRKDRGATAVEYGLMIGLIAVVIIVAVVALGGNLTEMFESVNERIGGRGDAAAPAGG
ncbi:Flp family type IVb pilin [Dietzia maris]|uniref:Flp family type IVb pilin n=1 Tax=Dietzia maris TaxID=37915 RepID=UPI0037C578E7